jgi:hypothetical protein
MSKKLVLVLSVLALVLAFGAVNVFADDGTTPRPVYNADEDVWTSGYADGRLNAYDIAQPVAVYYTYETVTAWDSDGEAYLTNVVTSLQLWAIDGDGVGQMALSVPAAQLNAAVAAGQNVQIAAANGYAVNYSASGYFWMTAPSGYSFTWEA